MSDNMERNTIAASTLSALFGAWLVIPGPTAQASSLDALIGKWPEANLRASLDPPGSLQIEQGGSFHVRVAADTDASVALVLVSPDSRARILIPHRDRSGDRVEPGAEMLIPDLPSGEILYADMPVGKATVYIIASSDALWPDGAGSKEQWTPMADVDASLTSAVAVHGNPRLAVARIPLRVVPASTKEFVSTEEFVQFYGVATRSVTNAQRGFAVQFAYGSAELTEFGRRQLDAVGRGMTDPRLAANRFVIEGHTDDVGTDEYNMDLSRRRAISVAQYLGGLGVKPARLKESALGKKDPAVPGTSEQARAANRRVVIRRQDSAQ